MGSASPSLRGDPARLLLLTVQAHCRECIQQGRNTDEPLIKQLLEIALDDDLQREFVLNMLAGMLCRNAQGIPLDPAHWPPLKD